MGFRTWLTLDPDHAAYHLRISFYVTEEHAGPDDVEGRPYRNLPQPLSLPEKSDFTHGSRPYLPLKSGPPIQSLPQRTFRQQRRTSRIHFCPLFLRRRCKAPFRFARTMGVSNGAALLSLKGVHRHYVTGGVVVRALDGIDLEVREGEVVMLQGPSGSGKTTLLNIVSALDSPTSGTYHFDGELVPSAPTEKKRRRISIPTPHPALRLLTWPPEAVLNLIMWLILLVPHYLRHTLPRSTKLEKMTDFRRENVGYVFQFFNLLGDLTALENVILAQEIHGGRDKERALQVLNMVGLAGMENRFPSELSGGEQQRVAIARSLAKSPRLLLGDELTGNLDSETTAQVMKVLVKVCRKENITAIIVTHDGSLTKYATPSRWTRGNSSVMSRGAERPCTPPWTRLRLSPRLLSGWSRRR
ncbi:MAG: hypothetical protein CXX72_05140 [Methanobacteriota archaeon]|nr:MAG: hypothetical protein CXX72_05140 [Euryarchaeota archaeon]